MMARGITSALWGYREGGVPRHEHVRYVEKKTLGTAEGYSAYRLSTAAFGRVRGDYFIEGAEVAIGIYLSTLDLMAFTIDAWFKQFRAAGAASA